MSFIKRFIRALKAFKSGWNERHYMGHLYSKVPTVLISMQELQEFNIEVTFNRYNGYGTPSEAMKREMASVIYNNIDDFLNLFEWYKVDGNKLIGKLKSVMPREEYQLKGVALKQTWNAISEIKWN